MNLHITTRSRLSVPRRFLNLLPHKPVCISPPLLKKHLLVVDDSLEELWVHFVPSPLLRTNQLGRGVGHGRNRADFIPKLGAIALIVPSLVTSSLILLYTTLVTYYHLFSPGAITLKVPSLLL